MSENMTISIRDAQSEDQDAIRAVTLAAYEEYAKILPPPFWEGYRQSIIKALDEEGPVQRIVAVYAGRIVGSVLLYPPAQSAYGDAADADGAAPEMRLLAVDAALRGHGIGTALTRECIQRARQAGAQALGLHTMNVMQTAMQMYERMGFVRVSALDFRPAENMLIKGYRLYFDAIQS